MKAKARRNGGFFFVPAILPANLIYIQPAIEVFFIAAPANNNTFNGLIVHRKWETF